MNRGGTALTVTFPPLPPGRYGITVGTLGGESAPSSGGLFTSIGPPTISTIQPSSGPAGTGVTITGSNFEEVTSVTFGGGFPAAAVATSRTSISACAPTGPTGTVIVTVTAIGGSSTGSSAFFAYTGGSPLTCIPGAPAPPPLTSPGPSMPAAPPPRGCAEIHDFLCRGR